MKFYNLSIGGGAIGKASLGEGSCIGDALPDCCHNNGPDVAHGFERDERYFRALNFSKEKQLTCWADADKVVAGDKLILFPVHAGYLLDRVAVENKHGCTGFKYHLELHDVLNLKNDVDTPEVVFPNEDGEVVNQVWYNVVQLNANALYYGSTQGTRPAEAGESGPQPCQKHKAVVLVIDALPTSTDPTTGGCTSCSARKFGCGVNKLACINLEVTAPVVGLGGLRSV